MKVHVKVGGARPELVDLATSELYNDLSSAIDIVPDDAGEASQTGRRSRMGILEFIVTIVSSGTMLKLADVLRAHVTRRSIEIELKRQDGATLKIEARGEGTAAVADIVSFLSRQPLPGPSTDRAASETSSPTDTHLQTVSRNEIEKK